MKNTFVIILAWICGVYAMATGEQVPKLTFDADNGVRESITMPMGDIVEYTAYRNLYYVGNVEDSAYQYLNIFIPNGADENTLIFMPNYVGGYMAAKAKDIDPGDASGRALKEGYVVVIPGARGRNSVVVRNGEKVYTGRAPKGLLDLKAAVRYIRHFDKEIPGDANKIITNGTSAGGAMSSLLGSTGNNPAYDEYLKVMGAADERDDIFAAVCFCPIIDLDHADMAYEWLYSCTNNVTRPLVDKQVEVSRELAVQFAEYQNSLGLIKPDGIPLTADNYLDYIKDLIIKSAQEAKDAGADIPDSIGFIFGGENGFTPPINGGMTPKEFALSFNEAQMCPPKGMELPKEILAMGAKVKGEYITDLNMETYLNYVVSTIMLKSAPAFDSQGVEGAQPSGENEEFGDETGSSVNFTDYSLKKATGDGNATVSKEIAETVRIMNPMSMISDEGSMVAQHWYIRHGARDRDTSFPIPINLATKLENMGKNVNFKLAWNRPHSGDYSLNELFDWIKSL